MQVKKYNSLNSLNTAVLFLIFNRLETTKLVFEEIRKAKPPRLYLAADGPRSQKNREEMKTNEVRKFVISNIDWDCEVKTLFRDENLGCKLAVSSAIDWFFENEEMGIILEDDCLPSQSFFWFCEELLLKYKYDMRIWHIGGVSTLEENNLKSDTSYYFSKLNFIWGWATWSSRWEKYDINVSKLDNFQRNNYIENITNDKLLQNFWLNNFLSVSNQIIDTWDYQWYFTIWTQGGISINPVINLIKNIGFGVDATHTTDVDNKLSKMKFQEINLNLIHPDIIMPNIVYDKSSAKYLFELNQFNYFKHSVKRFILKSLKILKW
jgi:GR25 family glycosyltransferase involved in LPS biosynthesis